MKNILKLKIFIFLIILMILPSYSFENSIRFIVTVPKYTPLGSNVFITGNIPQLGSWDPSMIKLNKTGRYTYEIDLKVQKGTTMMFKFTRGSWKTVEKDRDNYEISDRVFTVKDDATVQLKIENWADHVKQIVKTTLTGNFVILKDIYSKKLNKKRTIMVYLPPNYYINTGKRYPVLYMHDGNNVFDRSKATYGNEWNADETAEKLIKDGKIEEIIIVGIFNNSDRFREYTPYPSGKYPGGKLRDYADFIINDLKPIIDRKFRTRSDAKNTAIAGSSLGGVASFYLAWWYPEVFSMAGVISPTLWWADNAMFRDIESYSGSKKDLKIWIDMGTGEADCDPDKTGQWDPIKMCYELESYLEKKGYKKGEDVTVYIDKDAVHNEASWSKRFDKFLIFMFGK